METLKIIARIRSDFPEKFGIPRQSGVVPETRAEIVFEKPYQNPDALRGVEGFSHLWLRQRAHGCVCHAVAVSPQSHRAVVRDA